MGYPYIMFLYWIHACPNQRDLYKPFSSNRDIRTFFNNLVYNNIESIGSSINFISHENVFISLEVKFSFSFYVIFHHEALASKQYNRFSFFKVRSVSLVLFINFLFCVKQAVLIVCVQKYVGNFDSLNIVLAALIKVLFFLSTTPFC